jgi:hypothetical protein
MCPDVFEAPYAGLHWNFAVDARKRKTIANEPALEESDSISD